MAAPIRLVSCLASVLLASLAGATTVELSAGPMPTYVAGADWTWQRTGLAAPEHALKPRVEATGAGLVLSVELPGGGRLTFVPTGIVSRPSSRRMGRESGGVQRSLPAGSPRLLVAEADGHRLADGTAVAQQTWFGVDEVVRLRDREVKHDLLVDGGALLALGEGDIVASWVLELPVGIHAALDDHAGVTLATAYGDFVARIPAPVVADADDQHWSRGVARFALSGSDRAPTLSLTVPGSWARSPERAFPLRLDPTISLQPTGNEKTGFVDENGSGLQGEMVSGSLLDVGFGADVRAYAEFDTSAIPDSATILDVVLHVWLANHDNPGNPAGVIPANIKGVATPVNVPPLVLHAAIGPQGLGRIYVEPDILRTGPHFCQDSFRFDTYDLGPDAVDDLQAELSQDFFTLGFTSTLDLINPDPFFDHIDYIGYPEMVDNPFECLTPDFPGTRITLDVEYEVNQPPTCSAGGPYVNDCPTTPFTLDGTGSSDPESDPLTFAWTTSCPGTIANADQAIATLQLDPGCSAACDVTLAVSDGTNNVSCSAPVTAADTTPPEVIGGDMIDLCLWPPRHDFYCLSDANAHVIARDACQPGVNVRFLGCTSDQPDEAREPGRPENGDGHFIDDCQVSPDGQELCIRAERAGYDPVGGRNTFDGRHYGVAVAVDDGCGNIVIVGGTVVVPHDRRGGSGGQDDPCASGDRRRR
jgi:hypothetical protein